MKRISALILASLLGLTAAAHACNGDLSLGATGGLQAWNQAGGGSWGKSAETFEGGSLMLSVGNEVSVTAETLDDLGNTQASVTRHFVPLYGLQLVNLEFGQLGGGSYFNYSTTVFFQVPATGAVMGLGPDVNLFTGQKWGVVFVLTVPFEGGPELKFNWPWGRKKKAN